MRASGQRPDKFSMARNVLTGSAPGTESSDLEEQSINQTVKTMTVKQSLRQQWQADKTVSHPALQAMSPDDSMELGGPLSQ